MEEYHISNSTKSLLQKHPMLPCLQFSCFRVEMIIVLCTNASNPKNKLKNPNELFKNGPFNGGKWRYAYLVDSIGEASVLLLLLWKTSKAIHICSYYYYPCHLLAAGLKLTKKIQAKKQTERKI